MTEPADYAMLFSSPLGKAVLDELTELFYNNTDFVRDPYEISFNTGRRNVIQFIKNRIKTAQNPQPSEDLNNE